MSGGGGRLVLVHSWNSCLLSCHWSVHLITLQTGKYFRQNYLDNVTSDLSHENVDWSDSARAQCLQSDLG